MYHAYNVSALKIVTDAKLHTNRTANQQMSAVPCEPNHTQNLHQQPPPQKSSQNVAHLRFTLLFYTNFIISHASDILLIMNVHICFYFDSTNPLFSNYKHKLIPTHNTILTLSVHKQITLTHISFHSGTYNILIS